MTVPRRPGSELDVMRSAPILMAAPAEVEAERAELLPWLEREIAALPSRRAERRARRLRTAAWGGAALVAAAGALVVLAPWRSEAPPTASPLARQELAEAPLATLLEGRLESGSLEVLPGSRLGDESRFRTPNATGARLLTAGGATLAAFADSEFALPRHDDAGSALVELSRGAIGFAVPKLSAGQTFRVKTTDALVTVVGTRFFVSAGTPTCVRVEEGSVRVERASETRLLELGETWGCDGESVAPPTTKVAPAPHGEEASTTRRGREGQLDQQNRLLAAALAAERLGDLAQARSAFDELIRRYPESPFGPEARAGLARLKGR